MLQLWPLHERGHLFGPSSYLGIAASVRAGGLGGLVVHFFSWLPSPFPDKQAGGDADDEAYGGGIGDGQDGYSLEPFVEFVKGFTGDGLGWCRGSISSKEDGFWGLVHGLFLQSVICGDLIGSVSSRILHLFSTRLSHRANFML